MLKLFGFLSLVAIVLIALKFLGGSASEDTSYDDD